MTVDAASGMQVPAQSLATLLDLARRARQASGAVALGFMAVNDSHALAPYRQGALWLNDGTLVALSGVVQPEANAPYAQWLNRVCRTLPVDSCQPSLISPDALAPELAQQWGEWLPYYGLWLPFSQAGESAEPIEPIDRHARAGGLFLVRDTPWQEHEIFLLAEWMDAWRHAWRTMYRPGQWSWRRWRVTLRRLFRCEPGTPWWRQRPVWWAVGMAAILLFPIRLTVLAPGELVPANPAVIRAPQEGVVSHFFVKPNELVKVGQALFSLDDAPLKSRLEVAGQTLASSEAEYRQAAQLAVSDSRFKGQLALLTGKIEERRAEADFVRGQLERSHMVAPQDGIALFDDPAEWIGKPVVTGERILRIALQNDVEIEAWLPIADAIPLENGASVVLYLNSSPLSPVAAKIRYVAHDAVQRPDGSFAYRVRASLTSATAHRIGLKGTAKLAGDRATVLYWILRRPLAAIRQLIGY